MSKTCGLWKRGWKQRAGALALCGGMLLSGAFVAEAQENPQPIAVKTETQLAEANSERELPLIEEYLKQCWAKKQVAIDVRPYKITQEELNEIIFGIHYEEPEYYWTIHRSMFDEDPKTGFLETYYQLYESDNGRPFDRREELEREWEMVQEKTEYCKTDMEKALVVHEHLVDTIRYSEELGTRAHDIEGGILEKKAVCEGYALAYKFYMNRLGIPCKVVSGISGGLPHAWNQIQIDGKWYFVDATWDDPNGSLIEDGHAVKHEYFLTSEDGLAAYTWNKELYEACDDTTYDNAEWRWNAKGMVAHDGSLYLSGAMPHGDKVECGIWKYDPKDLSKPGELVFSLTDEWQVTSSRKGQGCTEITSYEGMLYYNTPTAVWKWNFDPEKAPEKVFELEKDISGEIWDVEAANGKIYYETGVYENSRKTKREYVIDRDYKKAPQPIAVTKSVMTVELGGSSKEIFLQVAAPGFATFTAKNPDICGVEEAYAGKSCKLIPKKVGETTIIVNTSATDHYLEGTADVKVIVRDGSSTAEKITLQYEAGANGAVRVVYAETGERLSNGAQIVPNTEVQFMASPDEGYSVKNWTVNGEVYKENGQIYTDATLRRKIKASTDRITVEFVREGAGGVKGDVNLNGKIEIGDVREVMRSICKKTELTDTQKQAADMNGNGSVDIEDLRNILRFICGK